MKGPAPSLPGSACLPSGNSISVKPGRNTEPLARGFLERGWLHFEADQKVMEWVRQIVPTARAVVAAPENDRWRRCGGTWLDHGELDAIQREGFMKFLINMLDWFRRN